MTRRAWLGLSVGLLFALRGTDGSREEDFVVIVHPSNRFDALSRSKVNFLFSRKVSRWPWGAEVEPMDLVPRSPARRWFTREVLRTTEEQLAEYWIDQKATRGMNPPGVVSDPAAAKALVAARAGAIAYIPAAQLDHTVKAIKVDP
jgi:hypothetical protein